MQLAKCTSHLARSEHIAGTTSLVLVASSKGRGVADAIQKKAAIAERASVGRMVD